MQILICDKSFLNDCKSFLILFFVSISYLLFVKFQMFLHWHDNYYILANFFRKHLKKCFIVVLTEDAYYIACNIQLIIWSDLLLIFALLDEQLKSS